MLCARGPALEDLKKRAKGMRNFDFLALQPIERFNDLLYLADIHILLQRAKASGLVMPSKLGPMMASGRSVVVTAEESSKLGTIASIGGVVVSPENRAALSQAIIELPSDIWHTLGANGRAYAEEHWVKDKVLTEMMEEVEALTQEGG